MATALQQLPPPDTGPAFNEVATGLAHMPDYSARMPTNSFDLKDHRYPTPSSPAMPIPAPNRSAQASPCPGQLMGPLAVDSVRDSWVSYPLSRSPKTWVGEKLEEEPAEEAQEPQNASDPAQAPTKPHAHAQPPHTTNAAGTPLPVTALPSGSPPRPTDRFSRDEQPPRRPSRASSPEPRRQPVEIAQAQDMGQRTSSLRAPQDQFGSLLPSSPRHPSLPAAGIGASPNGSPSSPIIPLSAGPSYSPSAMNVHISPKPRASAQYPTYITPSQVPAMKSAFAPGQIPKEEVCVECAMRDQDMADVDVLSPGIWERESDVLYEELVRREQEEETTGVYHPESSSRPRAKGQPLSEENLRLWLSMNPKEPSSRMQTLDQYVRSQRSLLEAEALAHARAMRESRQLEDRMRDTYSQLRRSAYELNNAPQDADETGGGVRIKPPRSASAPTAAVLASSAKNDGREVTLLENGMIVEHVDVRKEEKEERERRRKEERRDRSRARKSSRGSVIDVASIYSMPIPGRGTTTDSGFFSGGPRGNDSRASQSFSPRPSSVLTTGDMRPHMLPRAYSQASFSDMQSIGSSTSPRRSRFLGFKHLSSGWRSQESFAPSGSMMDMHVALQHEQQFINEFGINELGSNTPTLRVGDAWAQDEAPSRTETPASPSPAPKKKNGLKKIWKIVTGSSKHSSHQKGRIPSRSLEKHEDDTPLAPPPPLSYLVDQGRGGPSSRRHVSTPSLPSSVSPNTLSLYVPSPPTAPSSIIPSPTSSRQVFNEKESGTDSRKNSGNHETDHEHPLPSSGANSPELDARGRTTQSSSKTISSLAGPPTPATTTRPPAIAIRRDKSLPPLPGESSIEFPDHLTPEGRPQTMFAYDHLPMSASGDFSVQKLLPPNAPFRTIEGRRQSFGGMGSKPHPAVRSLPGKSLFGRMTPTQSSMPAFLAEDAYGEFGASHFSLNQLESGKSTAKPKQRRSKFGLSSLFSRKSHASESKEVADSQTDYAPSGARLSGSDRDDAATGIAYSGAGSAVSAHSSNAQRMSVTSRKNIAELVDQDPEFVAYRYPSTEQRLDLR
ncbi:hypothetical protein WOLCODRAFT_138353 [Wolfiporia cocos MD-104 SS10]|uniref:Proteophosphoglycan ppg4 n=1 Tax=Wolfiporia cocos (strain MD-104) TaxID=742152 RepID=A0A2H3JMQ0_WOLCO|nr:hypothetical protein WOLCODRAFT_138353 [Wolfiporia cocos MD-104 SS10]